MAVKDLYYNNFYVYPFTELVNAYGYRPEKDEANRQYPYTPAAFARELTYLLKYLTDDFEQNPRDRYNHNVASNTLGRLGESTGQEQVGIPNNLNLTKQPGNYFKVSLTGGNADSNILDQNGTINFWKGVKLLCQHLDQVGGRTKYWYDYVKDAAQRYLISLKNFPASSAVVNSETIAVPPVDTDEGGDNESFHFPEGGIDASPPVLNTPDSGGGGGWSFLNSGGDGTSPPKKSGGAFGFFAAMAGFLGFAAMAKKKRR